MKAKYKWRHRLISSAFILFAFCGYLKAATSDAIDIHVSIAGTKAVLVIGSTYYTFGALNVNVSSVSVTSISIQNNSPVFIETFTVTGANAISSTGGQDWTLAASTGPNQYALAAQFSNAQPANSDAGWSNDALTTSAQTCSSTDHGNGTEAESGSNVGINDTRSLWFRIKTPSSVTDGTLHTATVTASVL